MPFRRGFLLLLFALPCLLRAQEIKYIDITSVQQRTELRHPPAPSPDCKDGNCVGGGIGGASVGDGAPDQRDPRALGVYLLQVTPTEIRASEPFEAEFRIVNTGRVPIEVPVYPHLSDLQPSDESVPFSYFSLALVVKGESEQSNVPALGYIMLYGSHEHEGEARSQTRRISTQIQLPPLRSQYIFLAQHLPGTQSISAGSMEEKVSGHD